MNWILLQSQEEVSAIIEQSYTQARAIFKHSTRCSISTMAKSRLEREPEPGSLQFYYLDVLKHRAVSDYIADTFGIRHESPQLLLIENGKCSYASSHNGISMEDLVRQLA